ncbi:arsenate reductase ArsC [Arenimonas sp.]|uniref:arsenate reductase ArsC n=1 Tax=Arenimonas sp. TaxID=1872635 RepID=UPI0035AFF919
MKVLFLCTANSCRSIISEAVFNHLAPVGVRAYSAGSHPSGEVNPMATKLLSTHGIDTRGLHSKPIEAHAELSPDVVVTVCDQAAGEACPVYFGNTLRAHWGLTDPSRASGSARDIQRAFEETLGLVQARTREFLAARPWADGRENLATLVAAIGKTKTGTA